MYPYFWVSAVLGPRQNLKWLGLLNTNVRRKKNVGYSILYVYMIVNIDDF